jgi:hypothetical protein
MKQSSRIHRSMVALAALAAVAGTSQAAVLSWKAEHVGSPLDFLYEPWGSSDNSYDLTYGNTWTIAPVGSTPAFTPSVHGIDTIKVWFKFADDRPGTYPDSNPDDFKRNGSSSSSGNGEDAEEHVDIWLGSDAPAPGTKTLIANDFEVDGAHPSSSYALYEFVLNKNDHGKIFDDLAADGKLYYLVELQQLLSDTGYESKKGEDTYLKVAGIEATWTERPEQFVPEGGAGLALFGLTLAGLVGWRRRKQ